MATYVASMSQLIGAECARLPRAVLFGENINNGSRIVGICRNLATPDGGRIINVGNCEATHIGAGFGMMLNGVNAVLFAKQLDFMLLGMDHFVNTYNFIRCSRDPATLGAFTIIAVVCDQGYQGPQSSFNSLGDICSGARVPGFALTNAQDAPRVLRAELSRPGFRIIALSQRLFGAEMLDPGFLWAAPDHSVIHYRDGDDATIVCFNFSLIEGCNLHNTFAQRGMNASLFSANHVYPLNSDRILQSARRTGRLFVVDDSKSTSLAAHRLIHDAAQQRSDLQCTVVERGAAIDFGVCDDAMRVDYDALVGRMLPRLAA